MTDEALLYQEAQKRNLARDPEIGGMLISTQRHILINALRERSLAKEAKPTDQELRTYFERTRDSFKVMGALQAQHIQCRDRQTAWEAYRAIRAARQSGGRIPAPGGEAFGQHGVGEAGGGTRLVQQGRFHPGHPQRRRASRKSSGTGRWACTSRSRSMATGTSWSSHAATAERTLTFEEARDQVMNALMPIAKEQHIDDFLRQARRAANIEYFGEYAPGGGVNPRDLIRLAQLAPTPEEKLDILKQVIDEFPESEYVDDALFLAANVYLDAWSDIPFAANYLDDLVREHPDSEYVEQARYLLENMGKPNFGQPRSAADLQRSGG